MVSAVVVAAGKGTRMKAEINKQYLELSGRPIVYWTIERFMKDESIDEVIAVIVKEEEDIFKEKVAPFLSKSKPIKIAYGGLERKDSVQNGLNMTSEDCEVVIIHDGVRPFFTKADVINVIEGAKTWDGCIVGMPVKDTIKVIGEDFLVENTPNRSTLFAVHTPQGFRKDRLIKAYKEYEEKSFKEIPTDDASVVEITGGKIKAVLGSYSNIKITTPEDLVLASQIMKDYLDDIKK